MKKTLSIVIAIAMIAAMLVPMSILASATGVQEFATWDELAAAANANYGEGSYKLTADSTASVSIETFMGTFDGGNHTITTSVTLFAEVALGTVIKDFTVNQAKDADGNDVVIYGAPVVQAAVGSQADMPIWISGVTNNVNVTEHPEDQDPIAGILGYADAENHLYIYDVVNNGDMYSRNQTGGILGNLGHATGVTYVQIVNAVNNGTVYANNSYAGGIIGNVNAGLVGTLSYCINTGDVFAKNDAAGIVGHIKGTTEVTFDHCASDGLIDHNPIIDEATGTKLNGSDKTGTKYGAAGIIPRSDAENGILNINNCVVMGEISNDSTADGSAYSSADPFSAYANGGLVTITDSSYLHGMLAIGEQAVTLIEGATGFTTLDEVACKAAFDAIVAGAEVAPAPIVPGADSDETTEAPAGDDTTEAPAGDDTTAAPAGDDTTAAPVTTPAPASTTAAEEEGGCGSSISLAIVAVAAAGALVIARKRED